MPKKSTSKAAKSQPVEFIGAMSPLADPVVQAIFDNVENSGDAMFGFLSAVLETVDIKLGQIISITPQAIDKPNARLRGTRVDIRVETAGNAKFIIEVQLNFEETILIRNLYAAAQIIAVSLPVGTPASDFYEVMPRIIVINILANNIRKDSQNIVEPIKLMYTNEPVTEALDKFTIINVQLEEFIKEKPALNCSLYKWLLAWVKSWKEEKTIQEVVEMTPELKVFSETDKGFAQYMSRYSHVSADAAVRKEYSAWVNDMMRTVGELKSAENKGRQEGKLEERKVWESVVSEKDAEIAALKAQLNSQK